MNLPAHRTAPASWLRRRLTFLAFCAIALGATRWAAAQTSVAPLDPLAARVGEENLVLNCVWTLIAGFLVMFMQAGFALIETGMCRAKNAAHTMSMNMLVYVLSMAGFWVCGFAFMCGGANGIAGGPGGPATLGLDHVRALSNMIAAPLAGHSWGLIGLSGFFLLGGVHRSMGSLVWFFYMMVFMDTAATIPTGTLAERWRIKNFALFSVCVGAFIYPIYGCWMWGGGWLSQLGLNAGLGHGAVDFAGSSVVHLQGGVLAFVLVLQVGPRIGKYDDEGNPRPIFGHHMPMVIFGTLLLAFGWFGFNAGSTLGVTDRVGLIAVNTMLASGAGTAAAACYLWKAFGKPDPSLMCNGMLGGLVAITAGCAFVSPPAAVLIGLIGGMGAVIAVLQLEKRGIDDPVGAIGVHGVGGLWGLIAVGLFADGSWPTGSYNGVSGPVTGLFYGHHEASQLWAQCIAGGVCIAWNLLVGGGVFFLIGRLLGPNRVPPQVEIAGLDIPEMGTPGYPEFITTMAQEQVTRADISAARL